MEEERKRLRGRGDWNWSGEYWRILQFYKKELVKLKYQEFYIPTPVQPFKITQNKTPISIIYPNNLRNFQMELSVCKVWYCDSCGGMDFIDHLKKE